jgi:hypothetical protein
MAGEDTPPLSDWYAELIYPMGDEADSADQARALETVRMAMAGIADAIAAGRIENVEVSFEVPGDSPQGFTFSSPKEAES